ncbi:MAG: molybdopterin-dependent oxidoreductase [Spirochaetota bacterium]|nr:MAG: molybdopterin-dependent oxidoreductase [Spirochaetota bacterium]
MKKNILVAVSLTVIVIGVLVFIFFTVRENIAQKKAEIESEFDPGSIDIDNIENDLQFAETIPEYKIMISGLVKEDRTISFLDIVKNYSDEVDTHTITGVRTDDERVTISFTGIRIHELLKEIEAGEKVKNVIVYGSDFYAAVFRYQEVISGDIFLVWKKENQYMNPSSDGVLKIVKNNGLTKQWIKNPVLIDFISGFSDLAPLADRLDHDTMNFISQQNFFNLAIGKIPTIDTDSYRLGITGTIENPAAFTYDEILELPQESVYATLETISNPPGGRSIGNAIWTGVAFDFLLDMIEPKEDSKEVVFRCYDGYSTSITLDEARREGVLLAYKMNGQTLSPDHGYPLRLVVPEKYGMKWPKWIREIEIVDYDYKGYWEQRGWSDYAGRDRPDLRYD